MRVRQVAHRLATCTRVAGPRFHKSCVGEAVAEKTCHPKSGRPQTNARWTLGEQRGDLGLIPSGVLGMPRSGGNRAGAGHDWSFSRTWAPNEVIAWPASAPVHPQPPSTSAMASIGRCSVEQGRRGARPARHWEASLRRVETPNTCPTLWSAITASPSAT